MADPRQGITPTMLEFIKEFRLGELALGVFQEESNLTLTRLMAIKFFKSLFVLTKDDKDVLFEIVKIDPIKNCMEIVRQCELRVVNRKGLNMLHSAMFEMINQFGTMIFEKVGQELHSRIVEEYSPAFEWCPGLVDKFYLPDEKRKLIAKQEQMK